jgi:phosphoglycolate phosphatase
MNLLAPRFGREPISWEEFDHLRDMTVPQIIKHLKLPIHKIPGAIPLVLSEYRKIVHTLEPCTGIVELLNTLTDNHISYALLSSNSSENVRAFLQRHKLQGFDWVEGTDGILAKHRRLARQIRKHRLHKNELYYLGDESRDIEAAKRCKIKVIAVTWGFHTEAHLRAARPDFLVNEPMQIMDIVRSGI